MPQVDVFVINLKRSEERKLRMENLLAPLGLKYTFIEAVDGRALSSEEIADAQHRGRGITEKWPQREALTAGEIGCALSHLKAYRRIVDENLDYACILEDDLCIDHTRILRSLLDTNTLSILNRKRGFDFVYLSLTLPPNGSRWQNFFPNVAPVDWYSAWWGKIRMGTGFCLCKPCNAPLWGTVGYIVNKRACEIFLQEGVPVRRPADHLTSCAELFGIRQYLVNPLPISHSGEVESDIDERFSTPIITAKLPLYRRLIVAFDVRRLIMFLSKKLGITSLKQLQKKSVYYD